MGLLVCDTGLTGGNKLEGNKLAAYQFPKYSPHQIHSYLWKREDITVQVKKLAVM